MAQRWQGTAFDVVLRGYERDQVDDQLDALREELELMEGELTAAQERAARLADDLQIARATGRPAPAESFGVRVDKILRLAERDAAEIVAKARREADDHRTRLEEDVARLTALRDDVTAELHRAWAMLDRALRLPPAPDATRGGGPALDRGTERATRS